MARRYHEIKGLAEYTAKTIVSDEEQWKKFLNTAGHMYKYPFREQMLIYAQRPDATACASLELWNEKMNCWVNKGAQGIALIDEEGVHRSGLKYVFDVKDVHEARFIGRKPRLWRMEEEHKDYVIDSLEKIYGETDASRPFENRIMELANRIASEMAPDIVSDQLSMSVEGSYLDGLDDLNLEVRLQQTLAASIAYTVLERCGMDADIVGVEFPYLHEFNSIETLSVMGEASSELSGPILREIGRSISIYDREKAQEAVRAAREEYIDHQSARGEKRLANASERGYNALTPSGEERGNEYIESADKSAERSDYADRVHSERRLSDPESDSEQRAGGDAHEVRTDEEELSEGAQERGLQRDASEGNLEGALPDDTGAGRSEDGSSDRADGEGSGRGRADEAQRSDEVGRSDEQHQELSGGDSFIGADLQLNPPEEELKQLNLFDLFPSFEEQMGNMIAAEASVKHEKPAAFSLSDNQINEILRTGGGMEDSRKRIYAKYQEHKSPAEMAEFLKTEYRTTGKGFTFGDSPVSVWFDEGGMICLHEDKAFYVDRFGFTEVPEFLLEKVADLDLDEAAYKLGDRYISIQRTEEGFDYSIFDEEYHLLDGGALDDPDISMGEVLKQITDELKQPVYDAEHDRYTHTELQGNIRQKDIPVAVDYDELMEKTDAIGQEEIRAVRSEQEIVSDFRAMTEEKFDTKTLDGMGPSVIEEAVRERVLQIAEDYGLDVTVEDVIVSGSRCRGLENANSDLDVVVSYSGSEREDDFFNVLHDERMLFGTVELDINPINTEETGTLAQYLPGVEKYLTEKASQIEQNKTIEVAEKETPKHVVTFTVAESSEFHSFGELHEGIPRLEDALKMYEQLCEKSNLNGIPAVGINVHTVGSPAYEDMQCDFLSGKRLDLDALMYLPEMSQNKEVMEALHGMKEAYPEVEVIGRFPDEQQDVINSGPTVRKSEELTAQSLAEQLNQFAYDYDLYEYRDSVEDPEAHIAMLKNDIENGTTEGITSYLQEIVDQEDGLPEDLEKAKELLAKLAEYKPLAKVEEREEQNYNMIDNVLNNLPQDPEEKKEPAPQKEMRMAEVKKVRKRVSMKKLLAEKKVEVAEREKKPPEVGAPSKRPSMGVDD